MARVGAVNGLAAAVWGGALLAGCSSSKATPAPPTGPVDGGGLDATAAPVTDGATPPPSDANGTITTGDTGTRATACTGGPFVAFTGAVATLDVSGATQPLAGATIGFTSCAGFYITTDASGKASTQLTQGVALSPIYNGGPTFLATIGAELPATSDVSASATLFGLDVAPAIPGFQQDGGNAATIAISLQADPAATAPCSDVSGVTLTVTGHSEAVVSYANAGWPANPSATTTAPSTGPYVFLNGVQGAPKVAVTGSKSGCAVKLVSGSQTGSFLLVPGSVTVGVATVTN